ncbi:MAG TPA: EamA family transporter [Candidatus Saccharimonadia bacterium]
MFYIFAALVCYSLAILFGAYASRHAGAAVVSTISNVVSVAATAAFAVAELAKSTVHNERWGLAAAAAGGVAIGLFTLALNRSFATDKVAIVAPVVFGGSIFLSAFLSYLFFRERISPIQGAGLLFLAVGLSLIIYAKATATH